MKKIDGHSHLGVDLLFYLGGGYPYALDLPGLVTEGSRHGLDRWVVFPMVSHTTLSLRGMKNGKVETGDDALEKTPYAWENSRLLSEVHDLFPAWGRQTLPLMMIDPAREPGLQVAALRELRKTRRYHGLKIQATIIESPIRGLLGPGAPLLDFAESEDLPVLIHTSIHPADRWSQVTDILEVVRSRPRIRFCLAHSCRFDKSGLDAVAALPNAWFDCSAHIIHCRLATQDHPAIAAPERRFPSDYANPVRVLPDLAHAYPDRLIWGSDAPFHSYVSTDKSEPLNLVCTYEEEARCLRSLPEEIQERIAFHNTLAFLGLKELP
jgi:predicted TIM-barrel fold metal-dependent hydrolase